MHACRPLTWLLALALLAGATTARADAARARQNYLLYCMGCHGENGAGLEGHVPDMRKGLAELAVTRDGRAFLLRVPGVTQSTLDPALVAEVLNWTLREFGGAEVARRVRPFTSAEVAEARSRPLLEITATRASVMRGRGLATGQPGR